MKPPNRSQTPLGVVAVSAEALKRFLQDLQDKQPVSGQPAAPEGGDVPQDSSKRPSPAPPSQRDRATPTPPSRSSQPPISRDTILPIRLTPIPSSS